MPLQSGRQKQRKWAGPLAHTDMGSVILFTGELSGQYIPV